jgi:hypothetical protein
MQTTLRRGATTLPVRFEEKTTQGEKRRHAFVNVTSEEKMDMLVHFLKTEETRDVFALSINNDFYIRPDSSLFVDLSPLTRLRELTMKWDVICTHLPPNLHTLHCAMQNLLPPYILPPSLRKFSKIFYTIIQSDVAAPSALPSLIKANQQITDVEIYGENQSELLINAIHARSTPLQSFSIDSLKLFSMEEFAKIAVSVIELTCVLSEACCRATISPLCALRKVRFWGYPIPLSWLTGNWTFHLEEITITSHVIQDPSLDILDFVRSHPRLKFFNLNFAHQRHISTFAKSCQNFACTIRLFFPDYIFRVGTIQSEMILAMQSFPNAIIEVQDDVKVCIRQNLQWQPRLHEKFSLSAQETLRTMALALTRLKKYPHLLETREKPLVHVDPACIEWMMEDLSITDFG